MNRVESIRRLDGPRHRAIVKIVRVRPAMPADIVHRFRACQRVVAGLLVKPRAVIHVPVPHTPHIRLRIIRMVRQFPLRRHLDAPVHIQFLPQRPLDRRS